MTIIDNDLFDSRDVEARIRELEAQARDEYDEEELAKWLALRADRDQRAWADGLTFISESYFETYARTFAEDVTGMESASDWPFYAIDWDRAANDLRMDFGTTDIDGTTYYVRG